MVTCVNTCERQWAERIIDSRREGLAPGSTTGRARGTPFGSQTSTRLRFCSCKQSARLKLTILNSESAIPNARLFGTLCANRSAVVVLRVQIRALRSTDTPFEHSGVGCNDGRRTRGISRSRRRRDETDSGRIVRRTDAFATSRHDDASRAGDARRGLGRRGRAMRELRLQSEFLAIFSMVVLSIWLRQRGSPESKPVDAAHGDTGSS